MRPRLSPAAVALAVGLAILTPIAGSGAVSAAPVGAVADAPTLTQVPPSGSPTVLETTSPAPTPPRVTAPSAILQDLETGQVLFSRAPDQRRPIASVTKVMTALVVLESESPSASTTVTANAASQRGAELGLGVGERIRVRELLYAILLQSANDAAVALAEHVAGSEPGFVLMMNRRADVMGLSGTRFFGPTGLDDRGYSTAQDIAAITRAAYEFPLFARIVRTRFRTVRSLTGPARRIQNRNVLLWRYSPTIGVKTGFTMPAGHCLVAAARWEGRELLAVVLGSPEDAFGDGAALVDYGLRRFRRVTLLDRGDSLGQIVVEGRPVQAAAAEQLVQLVRDDRIDEIEYVLRPVAGLTLPILAGQKIGREIVFIGDRRAGAVDAVAAASVARGPPVAQPAAGLGSAMQSALRLVAALFMALVEAFL
ncbi:MAG: D-alanyl-D-alanine carboxypeptidase family protein [Actinomycetota bacterium]